MWTGSEHEATVSRDENKAEENWDFKNWREMLLSPYQSRREDSFRLSVIPSRMGLDLYDFQVSQWQQQNKNKVKQIKMGNSKYKQHL